MTLNPQLGFGVGADHRPSSGTSEPVDPPGSPDVDRKSR
jgi:hypothetical protein